MTAPGGKRTLLARFWASGDPYERITLALVLHSLVTVGLVGIVVFVVMGNMLRDRMRSEIERDEIQVVQRLEYTIDTLQEDLANLAANSLFVNAMIDTDGNQAYVDPFIKSYRSRGGLQLQLTLCDFTGKAISSNAKRPVRYDNPALLRETVDGGKVFADVVIGANGAAGRSLLLAYPIFWEGTGRAEGVLVAEVGIEALVGEVLREISQSQEMGVQAHSGKYVIFSKNIRPGKERRGTRRHLQVAPPIEGLELDVSIQDYRQLRLGRFVAIYSMVALMLLVLSVFPARTLSRVLTTRLKLAQEERALLEAKVQQAQKLESLGVLAGGIAHDFNNLLMGVLGNADLALRKAPPGSEVRSYLERIETTATRAAELTNQMLAYSGRGKFLVEAIDLSRLVEEMGSLLGTVISKQATLLYRLAPDLPAVEGDATQIRQVVMNLITNASDALGEVGGEIGVATGTVEADRAYLSSTYLGEPLPEGAYAYLEVSDRGSGMEQTTLERIFDPFFTTKQTGRGLGLAAVLGIVRGHGGGIAVSSDPGRGTTFRVLFPVSQGARPAPAETAAPAVRVAETPASRMTVLVVDDEPLVLQVAGAMLEASGYDVLAARDGEEALEIFRERFHEISAVLLDMTMPRMGGEETWREMHRIEPGVRVILSSGYSETEAMTHFPAAGPTGFVQKPYRMEVLREKIREALERPG